MNTRHLFAAMLCVFLSLAPRAQALDFPPISDAEKALTELPGQPGAPAVVLFEKAEVKMMDYPREASSFLKVQVRIKILTEEGKSFGEEEIPHSGFYRLKKVEGRTVLPDGRVVPLPDDAIFEERRSRSLKRFVTKLVFPAVEVGAILDYHYEVRWDSLFFLDPWYFHNRVPTLLSEITYHKPKNLGLEPWGIQSGSQKMQTVSDKSTQGSSIKVWIEDLPGVPAEDYSFPFSDLSSRFMMVPKLVHLGGERRPLMDSWRSTCELYHDGYHEFQRKDRDIKKKAVELTQGLKDRHAKIAAVHAFVRDEIRTQDSISVGVHEDAKADGVLKDRVGTHPEKALVLQSMLQALKFDASILWVADRSEGRVDLNVANPYWFDSVIVKVDGAGETLYLDPNNRQSGFNHLPPYFEGMGAVQFHEKKPQVIELPKSTQVENRRFGTVDLVVDAEGRLSGSGELTLEGQEAWVFTRWKDTPEDTAEAWREWLEGRHDGYAVDDVAVSEDLMAQTVHLTWSLEQRQEDVLGDEVTVASSRPLGPTKQIFSLPPEARKTPVQLLFARSEELTTTVTWPEGWQVDVAPKSRQHGGIVGTLTSLVEVDAGARKAIFSRYFDRSQFEFVGSDTYGALRQLYAEAAEADAQAFVLVSE